MISGLQYILFSFAFGVDTKDCFRKFGLVKLRQCVMCGRPGREKHRPCECLGWRHIRLQVEEVERFVDCVHDSDMWLWEEFLPLLRVFGVDRKFSSDIAQNE